MVFIARTAFAAALSLGLVAGASATTLVQNSPNTPVEFEAGFGVFDSPRAGQLFTTPGSANIMTGFTLTLGPESTPDNLPIGPITVQGIVAEWDETLGLFGEPSTVLYTSSDQNVDLGFIADGNTQAFNFTVNLALDTAKTYVAYLTLEGNLNSQVPEDNQFGSVGFGFIRNSASLPLHLVFADGSGAWFEQAGDDALFSATFEGRDQPNPVPAPAAFGIFAIGLAGLVAARRRKAA